MQLFEKVLCANYSEIKATQYGPGQNTIPNAH